MKKIGAGIGIAGMWLGGSKIITAFLSVPNNGVAHAIALIISFFLLILTIAVAVIIGE